MKKTGYGALLSLLITFSLVSIPSSAFAKEEFVLSDGVTITDQQPILDPAEANHFAFEGGTTGTFVDTRENIQVPEIIQRAPDDPLNPYNIPTSAPASPLDFGLGVVAPFTQKLLRFEEFGTEPLATPEDYSVTAADVMSFPPPLSHQSGPDWGLLDIFLDQEVFPYPTEAANTAALNPWQADIENFLGRNLDNPPAEGRPPGPLWAHQRYDEFYPDVYSQTAQAGARTNGGLRDDRQRHGYGKDKNGNLLASEFAPGGLYYNTVGNGDPAFDGTSEGIEVQFHPNLPVQNENSVFTFDGTFPPKLLNVRYGEGILFRHYNALPIDPAANMGFGLHTITTHEHNGHTPAESDGYTQAFYFPGQFFDYRWPISLAGYDSINTNASDPKAGMPNDDGSITNIRGDYRETMSTHWFHDHMLDFTAQNVYKGNAAMMNYYSSIDRGNEAINDGVNLRFPSGTALGWGNRDYDVNLLISAKAWDSNGQLFFNQFNTDGFLGDRMHVNWLYKPTMDVRERRYRFRLLNATVSRYLKLAFVTETGAPVPTYMIANDGNIMEHAVLFPSGIIPAQGIAERYDVIIDFANYDPGTRIYMYNVFEHKNGRGPEDDAIPLADILSGAYNPVIVGDKWVGGDPVVGSVMEFVVQPYDGTDLSMDPADFVVGQNKMIPLRPFTAEELANATHRTYVFGGSGGTDEKPWTIKTDGGTGYNMDPRRLSAAPDMNGGKDGSEVEIWHLETGGGWSHPIHVHFEEGQILSRDGIIPPEWETVARKDVYRLGSEVDSSRTVTFAIRFREFAGTYMEHCHNTQHEDTSMLLRWDIEKPGETILLPTPMPTWDGVNYVDSFALPTFRTGIEPNTPPLVSISAPASGSSFALGESISFTGTATDLEDDDIVLTAALAWTSSLDGAIGFSGSFSTSTLSEGTHTITASVTDSGDPTFNPLTGSVSISITITAAPVTNTPPVVSISLPADGTSVVEGTAISFTGTAVDTEDDDTALTAALDWSSDLVTGSIGTGGSISATLPVGIHTITTSVTDSGNPDASPLTGSASITVEITMAPGAPTISISLATWTAPGEASIAGSVFPVGSSVSVFAPGTADVTGNFCTGTFIADLPTDAAGGFAATSGPNQFPTNPGEYCVSSDNGKAASAVTNTSTNSPPLVSIISPADGVSFLVATPINFSGTAIDAEDDDATLAATMVWTSSADGQIGTGASFSTTALSVGTHTITAAVTDSGNPDSNPLAGSASISITITSLPPVPAVDSFSATPPTITAGGSSTLAWTTTDSTSVSIDNGVGTGLGANSSISVSPTVTTTYTLTATGPGGTASATVTVTVNVAAPAPTVVSFTATPATITSGGSSLLEWVTTDTDSVTIDPGVGTFAGNTGSSLESPTVTTTYTLTATGPGGTASASVTVTVNVGPAPSISISLATWEASNGNAAIAGSVFPVGSSVTVYVPGTTTDGIACTGGGDIIATLATDGAGNFAAQTGPGGLLSNPGEYCVDSDNGTATSLTVSEL